MLLLFVTSFCSSIATATTHNDTTADSSGLYDGEGDYRANFNCSNITLSRDDYDLLANGSVYIDEYELRLNESSYLLENHTLTICKPEGQFQDLGGSFNSNCSNVTLGQDDFFLLANDSAYIKKYELLLNQTFYSLENESLTICEPESQNKKIHFLMPFATTAGLCVGIVSVALLMCLHIHQRYYIDGLNGLAYCYYKGVGCCTLLLCLIISVVMACNGASVVHIVWYFLPAYSHLFMLVSFSIMSMMSADVHLFAGRDWRSRYTNYKAPICSYEGIIWWGFIQGITYVGFSTMQYPEDDNCTTLSCAVLRKPSLTYFTGQVLYFSVMNLFVFILDNLYRSNPIFICKYYSIRDKCKLARIAIREDHMVFFKMSIVLTLTWNIGALGSIPSVSWMYSLFVCIHIAEVCYFVYCTLGHYRDRKDFGRVAKRYGFDTTLNEFIPVIKDTESLKSTAGNEIRKSDVNSNAFV